MRISIAPHSAEFCPWLLCAHSGSRLQWVYPQGGEEGVAAGGGCQSMGQLWHMSAPETHAEKRSSQQCGRLIHHRDDHHCRSGGKDRGMFTPIAYCSKPVCLGEFQILNFEDATSYPHGGWGAGGRSHQRQVAWGRGARVARAPGPPAAAPDPQPTRPPPALLPAPRHPPLSTAGLLRRGGDPGRKPLILFIVPPLFKIVFLLQLCGRPTPGFSTWTSVLHLDRSSTR